MSRLTVESYKDVVESVQAFNKGLGEGQELEGHLSYYRAWYYIPELGMVGPSKFIGYRGMTAAEYMLSEDLDGRITEPVLGRWFNTLDSGTAESQHVAELVRELLARYKKAPNRIARFNAPPGWELAETAGPPVWSIEGNVETVAFEEFWTEVQKYPSMWDSIELKAVAAEKGGSAYLLGLHCTLSSGLTPGAEVLFDAPNMFMVRQVEPFSRLPKLLEQMVNGQITLANRAVNVEGFVRYQRTIRRGNGHGWVDIEYPYVLLYAHGKSGSELANEDDLSRMLLSYGYQDIPSLTQEKLGFQVGSNYSTRVYFIAPIYLEATAAFVDDRLRLALRCGSSIDMEDLSASYEVTLNSLGKRETSPGKIELGDAMRLDEAVGYSVVMDIDLPTQAESAIIWVFHTSRNEPLYALRVEKQATIQANPIWGATKLVLSRRTGGQEQDAQRILHESLGVDTVPKDPNRLEAAVHTLLACAGYSCVFTGRMWGTQGIDTIGFSHSGTTLMAISVTTSNNVGEKIRTLLPQLNKLRAELTGFDVVPAVFATVEPADIADSDRRDAAAHRISLMLLPEIAGLLDALSNQSQDKLAEFVDSTVRANVPSAPAGFSL